MHAYNVVVTQFLGRALYAEICVDGVPRRRLVGIEKFRTAPVSAEQLNDEVQAILNESVRNEARKLHVRPADIIWP